MRVLCLGCKACSPTFRIKRRTTGLRLHATLWIDCIWEVWPAVCRAPAAPVRLFQSRGLVSAPSTSGFSFRNSSRNSQLKRNKCWDDRLHAGNSTGEAQTWVTWRAQQFVSNTGKSAKLAPWFVICLVLAGCPGYRSPLFPSFPIPNHRSHRLTLVLSCSQRSKSPTTCGK